MQGAVYVLCAATALACCVLLLRGYRRSRVRLLMWCGLCFVALTVENVLLYVDLMIVPERDLSAAHFAAAGVGVLMLLFGLIWETK